MELSNLRNAVESHAGSFRCVRIHKESLSKVVAFRHDVEQPDINVGVPEVGKLQDFYTTFGSLTLYLDDVSGDAAVYIARRDQWDELEQEFRAWLDGLSSEEIAEFVPEWTQQCVVVGEVPSSGNYFMVPLAGSEAGCIYEFEHDGFEFIRHASDIESFVFGLLDPDSAKLTEMASHMSFVEQENWSEQWWIQEMRDNRGNVVST